MSEFLDGLRFWHWLIVGFVLGMIEVFMPGAAFIWFGAAALVVGLIVLLVPALSWQLQIVLFAVLACVAVYVWWQRRKAGPQVTDQPNLNQRGAHYLGQVFTLVEPIANGSGKVQIGDSVWKVLGPDLPAGARVRVSRVEGALLVVERVPP